MLVLLVSLVKLLDVGIAGKIMILDVGINHIAELDDDVKIMLIVTP